MFLLHMMAPGAGAAYSVNMIVADMRQPTAQSGSTACPQITRADLNAAGGIHDQWSTSLGTSPVTVLTADQTSSGRLNEIENTIAQAFGTWTHVPGSKLVPGSLAPLARTSVQASCAADGVNSICFNQNDPAFATGVLAFTRVVAGDTIGERVSGASAPSTFIGQILDADIMVRPGDSTIEFATPAGLAANPTAYDLESILIHEMGHSFGAGHSDVWRAIMFPFVAPAGAFAGTRPSPGSPDAPLSDDDRAMARELYPDPSDTVYIGSIAGRILPANTLELSGTGTSGIFAAHVVALNAATGAVASAAISGWSCSGAGPPVFDGSYKIAHLPVSVGGGSQTYQIYAEPLDGPVAPSDVFESTTLCRNALSDPGWPASLACITPAPITNFSVKVRSGP